MKESNKKQGTNSRPPPKTYTPEFKVSIARQVIEEHANQSELSRQTGVAKSNIHKWVLLARRGQLAGYTAPSFDEKTGDVVAENRRLERELARVTGERDFLKRAAAFFARETR